MGQDSPVTTDRRRASTAVAATVSPVAASGRPQSAAVHAAAVHQEA